MPTPAKYKKQYPVLREVDSLALANAQVYLDRAFKNFYREKGMGFPKRKRKKRCIPTLRTINMARSKFWIIVI